MASQSVPASQPAAAMKKAVAFSGDFTDPSRSAVGGGKASTTMAAVEHMSPATRLLEKRRQMFEVQELLEARKAEYKEKEARFKSQEDELRRKDLELQESLIKFSKFLQENEAKRMRAMRKAGEDQRVISGKEEEIARMQGSVADMEAQREQMQVQLAAQLKYQHYLESVVEAAREAGEAYDVDDLLRRHATLTALQSDLQASQRAAEAELQALRSESSVYHRSKSDELLSLNNDISSLKQQLEAVRADSSAAAARRDASLAVAAQRALELGQVHMSIANIYRRCRQHSCVAHREGLSPVEQLDVIGNFVGDLGQVIRQHRASMGSSGRQPAVV